MGCGVFPFGGVEEGNEEPISRKWWGKNRNLESTGLRHRARTALSCLPPPIVFHLIIKSIL